MDKASTMKRNCWCGNKSLEDFSPGYSRCSACGTLVYNKQTETLIDIVSDEKSDLYGSEYWFSRQEQANQATISQRMRSDLSERCLYWLKTFLRYQLPPAKVLELGCAHGGFVSLLRNAGFDATGLELSPAIVELAKKSFEIPVLHKKIEEQSSLPAGSFDSIVLMDVLEHLDNPLATMQCATKALSPAGCLVIQTPKYPEDKSFEQLVSTNDHFKNHLNPDEHVYLFSERAVRILLDKLGFTNIVFEPAIYAHYDMFIIASRKPLANFTTEQIEGALSKTATGRWVQALLDIDQKRDQLWKTVAKQKADISQLLGVIEQERAAFAEERNNLQLALDKNVKKHNELLAQILREL